VFHTDDPGSFSSLVAALREDLIANSGQRFRPGYQALVVYRFGVWSRRQTGAFGWLTEKLYVLAFLIVRGVYGIELPRSAVVGRRLSLPHAVGVVIGQDTWIGDDCTVRQNVTIGRYRHNRDRSTGAAPKVGNRVEIGPGAKVVGGVLVGDDSRIGPNAVVTRDVPSGASAFVPTAGILMPPSGGEQVGGREPVPLAGEFERQKEPHAAGTNFSVSAEVRYAFINLLSDLVEPDEEIEVDTPLLSTGLVDSFDIAALLSVIEDVYGVTIEPDEVDTATFDTPLQMLLRIEAGRS
jgi:serine O-acetyltransferase